MSSNLSIPKECVHCGKAFIAKTTVTQFCSHRCASRNYKARKKKEKLKEAHQDQLSVIKMRNDILKEKPFLDVKELGQILGISRATIYRMISNGDIPFVKMGGRTKFRQDDITRIFQSRVQS